jgi:hypothetical protein
MTAQRARAYGRVMRTCRDLGPPKLLPPEQARIRRAADALVFSTELPPSASAHAALADLYALRDHLVFTGRWTPRRAGRLIQDVLGCGPPRDDLLRMAG